MNSYVLIFVGVIFSVIGQLLLKKSSLVKTNSVVLLYSNVFALCGYLFMAVSTILNVLALREIEIKELIFIFPLNYILVPILAIYFFDERIEKVQISGMLFVFFGSIVFNSGKLFL